MKEEDKIRDRFGTSGGWKVPEGYFDSFYAEMMDKLPAYPTPRAIEKISIWNRLKPYVYLAAMFAGIWLMMKVFFNMSGNSVLSIDNPPEKVAYAMSELPASDLYIDDNELEVYSQEAEVVDSYNNIGELEKDFGFELSPKYKKMNINNL